MTKQKQISVRQRITELKKLISDGLVLGFASHLIMGYNQQLTTLQAEQERDKVKSKVRRGLLRCQ